jgi:hypothetical protein
MRTFLSTLKAVSVIVVPMLVAVYSHAGAQTVTGAENVTKRVRVTAKVFTVVNAGGNVIRSNDGKNWDKVESANTFTGSFQREFAKREGFALATASSVTVSPNPTAGMTTINYELAQSGNVLLTLHDARGIEVLRRTEEARQTGMNSSALDATLLPNGIYYYRIMIDGMTANSGKVVIAH